MSKEKLHRNIPQDFYNKHKKEYEYYGRGGVECDVRKDYESYQVSYGS